MELVITNVEQHDLEYIQGVLRYKNTFIKVPLHRFTLIYDNYKKSYTMSIIVRNNTYHNLSVLVLNQLKATIQCEKIMDTTVCLTKPKSKSDTLYEYQLQDVEWMESIENRVDNNTLVISEYISLSTTVFDENMNLIDTNTHPNPVYAKGGCLVNEVGLGKTLTVLELIKRSCKPPQFKVNYMNCNYKYKRNLKRGKFCEKKLKDGNLYCGQHSRNVFQDTLRVDLSQDYKPKINNGGLYESTATLVFCPSHLVNQWVSEIKKFFCNSLTTLVVVNRDNLRNVLLHELLCVDLVIISSSVIANLNVYNQFSWRNINFKRIVYDESHELYDISYNKRQKLCYLQSDYVWNVSGTPLPRMYYNYYYNIELLTGIDSRFYMYTICYDTVNYLYRRSTKDSVKLSVTNITEKTEWVDFLKVERELYNSYKLFYGNKITKELVQLCCHPELIAKTCDYIKECTSLEEISKKLLGHNILEMNRLEISLLHFEQQQKEMQIQEVMTGTDKSKKDLVTCKKMCTDTKNKLLSKKKLVDYLGRSLNELENESSDSDCAICLGEFSESICILPCGHKFCSECIMGCICQNKCPTCKGTAKKSDLLILNKAPELDINTEGNELAKELKSSKLAHIIKYIRSLKDTDKCVIFSQWKMLLHKMGKQLSTLGIECVFCEGSVYKKTSSIKRFTNDPNIKIILLSSKNAASGINLVVANKLILIEPVYGNKEYKENIENQAIGRIHRIGQKRDIDIVRFLVKDTVEQDISDGKSKLSFKI
jgi:SWI/SNF-related matrix-associated actin-dependent regulator of chromatin subfamily A3